MEKKQREAKTVIDDGYMSTNTQITFKCGIYGDI